MSADDKIENRIAKLVVDAGFQVHTALGPGLFEAVYETALAHELKKRGLGVARQVPIPVHYDGVRFDEGFRADLLVDDRVILELKSLESLAPVHKKQLLTYLRLSGKKLGLLLNFGTALYKQGVVRLVNGL